MKCSSTGNKRRENGSRPEDGIKTLETTSKTRNVNIGTKEYPKFVEMGDYWDDKIVEKIFELLHKY
jgi:hypothetical protein